MFPGDFPLIEHTPQKRRRLVIVLAIVAWVALFGFHPVIFGGTWGSLFQSVEGFYWFKLLAFKIEFFVFILLAAILLDVVFTRKFRKTGNLLLSNDSLTITFEGKQEVFEISDLASIDLDYRQSAPVIGGRTGLNLNRIKVTVRDGRIFESGLLISGRGKKCQLKSFLYRYRNNGVPVSIQVNTQASWQKF